MVANHYDTMSRLNEDSCNHKGHPKDDTSNNNNNKKKKRRARRRCLCCSRLTIITLLIAMEAATLTYLCLRSHTIMIDPFFNEDDPYEFLAWLDTSLGGGSEHDRYELAELEG